MERAIAELIASGQAAGAIKAGDRAPHFNLKDQDGNDVSSAALLLKGPLVVTFYRGAWCPYCNIELQAINEVLPQIQTYGANVVAISPQTPLTSRKSVRTNELGFPVLSDMNGRERSDARRLRTALRAARLSGRALQEPEERSADVQQRSQLDLADAGALCHRTGRHRAVFRGQSGLHASSRPVAYVPGSGKSDRQRLSLTAQRLRLNGHYAAPENPPRLFDSFLFLKDI